MIDGRGKEAIAHVGEHIVKLDTLGSFDYEFIINPIVDIGIGKSNNGAFEHFSIQLFNNGVFVASEDIVLTDGKPVLVDAADWGNPAAPNVLHVATTGTFGAFDNLLIENIAGEGPFGTTGNNGDDAKVNITGLGFNQQTVITSTSLESTTTWLLVST